MLPTVLTRPGMKLANKMVQKKHKIIFITMSVEFRSFTTSKTWSNSSSVDSPSSLRDFSR